ncbi:MAG: metal-dependent hydrolase [Hyphomicrobiaceae bacterium]|nr:metal-dependent hydrolase [Hyphomicrobiaceae bacterium]
MANFPTHLGIGTLTSGMLATLTLAANVVAPESLIAVTAAGVLGSVLPDIDLKDSRPGRAMFFGLATFFAFVALFANVGRYSIAELWLLAAATFLCIRYVAHFVFHRFSYHRGIFHSVLAGLFFACLTAIIYRHLLGRHEGVAWLAGGFMLVGYMVHLTLDEIYSVDVMDTRIKASFGTALKLWDGNHLGHSAAMAAATAGLFMLTPSIKPFSEGISSPALWSGLKQQMLPKGKWFGIIDDRGWLAQRNPSGAAPGADVPSAASDVTTGSVDRTPASPNVESAPSR